MYSDHAPSCVQNACKKGRDRCMFAKNNFNLIHSNTFSHIDITSCSSYSAHVYIKLCSYNFVLKEAPNNNNPTCVYIANMC